MLHTVVHFEQTINTVFHKIKTLNNRAFSATILSSGHKNTENNIILLKRGYQHFEMLPISRQFFEKYSNTKFNENPSSGSRDVPCGRTEEQTGAMTLIFRLLLNETNRCTIIFQLFISGNNSCICSVQILTAVGHRTA